MPNVNVKIHGITELQRAIRQYPELSVRRLQKAVERGIAVVHNLSARHQGIVPVKTGNLSNSFSQGIKIQKLRGEIGPTAKYAVFVNDGTRHMKPRRFMEKLAKRSQPKINQEFKQALTDIVDDVARRAK